MSFSFSHHHHPIPQALPSLSSAQCRRNKPLYITSNHTSANPTKLNQTLRSKTQKPIGCLFDDEKKGSLAIQLGILLATALEQPAAIAVTGENNYEIDYTIVAIKLGIIAFWYFLIMPPIIMNWLRVRWYKRKLLEMYLQFMCVFLFFPGVLVWAPFLNFRKFPRDPSMKYPWAIPEDPSKIKNDYLKFPWAQPEDYD